MRPEAVYGYGERKQARIEKETKKKEVEEDGTKKRGEHRAHLLII